MSSSSSSSSSSNLHRFNTSNIHLWLPLLMTLISQDFTSINAQRTIMLPTESAPFDSSSSSSSHLNLVSQRCSAPDPNLNFRPVIGIVSHPGDGASGRLNNGSGVSYIAASYVKLVESAGARVIPLIYTEPLDVIFKVYISFMSSLKIILLSMLLCLLTKLELVNGVLFTGGWAKTGLYFDVVGKIFKKVLEKNDEGQFFPCYGICLGFELITMIVSEDNNILESFSSRQMASTLQFVENVNIEGTVFQRFPPELLRKLSTDCLVMQNHRFGISPKTLQGNQRLSSFFDILTTCTDEDDKVYVSTVQAKHYPITGFQWHPEKNAFEWGSSMIPHSEDAIKVTQNVANFFISEARKSTNKPPAKEVLDYLIYNYSPTYCGTKGKGFDEVYIFA